MPEQPEMTRALKTIRVGRDYKQAIAGLDFADPRHANRRIDTDALILMPGGRITALLLKHCFSEQLLKDLYELATLIHNRPDRRPKAVGSKSMPRILHDGGLGTYLATPNSVVKILERDDVRQGAFGAMAGKSGRPPHLSSLSREKPEWLSLLRPLIEEVNRLYAKYLPSFYEFQRRELKKASPEFRLWHTAFSSAYMPVHLRSGYHADESNLPGGMSALLSLGDFTGGQLVVPRWRIAFELTPGDLLLFDGLQLHGNLPIVGDRASLVLYCARGLRF
jgi:hypothetical protein